MLHKLMTRLSRLSCAALLATCAGCGHLPPIVEHLMVAQVPETLLVCQDAPTIPEDTATQKDVAVFVAKLWGAWDNCSGNLRTVKDVIQRQTEAVRK